MTIVQRKSESCDVGEDRGRQMSQRVVQPRPTQGIGDKERERRLGEEACEPEGESTCRGGTSEGRRTRWTRKHLHDEVRVDLRCRLVPVMRVEL